MHHKLTLRVRQFVYEAFRELGVDYDIQPFESFLIQGGYYCGRRFTCEHLSATWRFEDNQVTVYDAGGAIRKVIDVPSDYLAATQARAA